MGIRESSCVEIRCDDSQVAIPSPIKHALFLEYHAEVSKKTGIMLDEGYRLLESAAGEIRSLFAELEVLKKEKAQFENELRNKIKGVEVMCLRCNTLKLAPNELCVTDDSHGILERPDGKATHLRCYGCSEILGAWIGEGWVFQGAALR